MSSPTRRGPCPDSLAVEVYERTLAGLRRRYHPASPHRQTLPDAVGAVFAAWLATPRDKTAIAAGLHAHFLIRLVCKILHGRRRGGGARPCVGERLGDAHTTHDDAFEATLQSSRGTLDGEQDTVERLDAGRRVLLGRQCESAPEAVQVLRDRAWTLVQIAEATGASEPTVQTWAHGRLPHHHWRPALLRLAATDGPPPPAVTGPELHAARNAAATAGGAPSAEAIRDALASLLRVHTQRALAALLGVTSQAVSLWAVAARTGGQHLPRPAQAAEIVRLGLALTSSPTPAKIAA